MTSSSMLSHRRSNPQEWGLDRLVDTEGLPMKGWEDIYITPGHTHECHPSYTAVPIGNPSGMMVCVKRREPSTYREGSSTKRAGREANDPSHKPPIAEKNGYTRYAVDLYDPEARRPRQLVDPYDYADRIVPDEEYYHQFDYLARDMKYNATGVSPVRTPYSRDHSLQKQTGTASLVPVYQEYGYSYTSSPPPLFDVTRLEQPYPVWKNEMMYQLQAKGMTRAEAQNVVESATRVGVCPLKYTTPGW